MKYPRVRHDPLCKRVGRPAERDREREGDNKCGGGRRDAGGRGAAGRVATASEENREPRGEGEKGSWAQINRLCRRKRQLA